MKSFASFTSIYTDLIIRNAKFNFVFDKNSKNHIIEIT